jgi:hypothetical protein
MKKIDFITEVMSDLMYENADMDVSEAQDKASRIWDDMWGDDVEEAFLGEDGDGT